MAPPEATSSSSSAPADELCEAVVVCIDRSGSMGTPLAEKTINEVTFESRAPVMQRTRMEGVKAMFYAFRDATETVGGGTHKLALLSFDNEVETRLGLTSRLADFEAIVDDIERRGQTAIFSSVVEAAAMLAPVFEASPQTDLRIIVLTDGQNNTGAPPQAALAAAQRIGAVVDALIVGDRPDRDLRRLVTATGGQAFQINDLGSGFELLENAGVASLKARRGGDEAAVRGAAAGVDARVVRGAVVRRAAGTCRAAAGGRPRRGEPRRVAAGPCRRRATRRRARCGG